MEISTHMYSNNIFEMSISNIGINEKTIKLCNEITKCFCNKNEFFFGFYREDGYNLNNDERIRYRKEIPDYFKIHGRFVTVAEMYPEKKIKKSLDSDLGMIGSLPVSEETYNMLPKIFNYYLETMYFSPQIDWEVFKELYRKNSMENTDYYIKKGFSDFNFAYVDSGDFKVTFDLNKYNKDIVYNTIMDIISK